MFPFPNSAHKPKFFCSAISMQIGGKTFYSTGNYLGYEGIWTDPMKIDNIRLHSAALKDNEVKAIYEAESK